ncbi:ATP-binding protein [uncultured Methanobrevibacter sp.]|uniref:ATP-binding protein n=1 Tax=uncultured Methanobrevibacter sp. TaxID=253161 RepID=UPI002600397B|nr:ATP-binding protein [uncultured Methanobrevibacter sp.]
MEKIKEINNIITKIKNNREFELNLIITLPVLCFIKSNNLISNEEFNMIISDESLKIKELKHYSFNDFNKVSEKIDEYLSTFTNQILKFLPKDADIQSIDFMLYELLVNIYKHSKFENAYIQIINESDEDINICIFDNGIGIPKSFEDASIPSENDCEALFDSINGKTSDKEKYSLRGRGLNSTARITTLGLCGNMTIASGSGVCTVTKNGAKTYFNDHNINGTFVILKIKNKKVDNIYKYLKFKNINKIEDDNNA